MLRICEFSIDCKIDNVCVGDPINVGLKCGNKSWIFEGNIIFGKDTLCYKENKFEGDSFFVAKEPIGTTPLIVKGRFTHDKFTFDYEKEIKKITIEAVEDAKAESSSSLIIKYSIGAALLIAGVIVFFVIRNKKKKMPKRQSSRMKEKEPMVITTMAIMESHLTNRPT